MKRSLQWRLSMMLGGTVLIIGLVATVVTFFIAYSEAKEFQDHTLRQLAVLINHNVTPISEIKTISGTANLDENLSDPEERISVYRIPRTAAARLFNIDLIKGIQTLNTPTDNLRCYVYADKKGNLLTVTQPVEMRNELALDSALHVFAPMILLLPLMTMLITQIIRRELKPVKMLAEHLDKQPVDQPKSLPYSKVPSEIDPFVQAINRLLSRVGLLLNQQRRFVADAAHELRSPLTALSLQIQNLQTAESLEAVTDRVQPLQSGIERAIKLTEQLLNLARAQLGETEHGRIDVSALIRRLIEEHLPIAELKHIDLGLDEKKQIEIVGSEKSFYLIVKNGLENALKYTPPGGVVTIKLYTVNDTAYCDVVDNGPGIDESLKERLFDPFFRPPEVDRDGEGNGLGLAIAREAASSLGGHVDLINGPDKTGLIFRYRQTLKTEMTN